VVQKYTHVVDYVWAQEEPRNMGSWSFMFQRFEINDPKGNRIRLNVRSGNYYSVPAPGSSTRFKRRHEKIIESVFDNQ